MIKKATVVVLILVGLLFSYVALSLPPTGDHEAPAALHVSPRYIEKAYEETKTPNMVCAVLADYRSYDTLGETVVIVVAGIATVFILGVRRPSDEA
ncbi:MAG: hypothetical protein IBX71_08045 [Candidatus Desulforudis sp.]|nr:hypothetical protein [Desulforudis sp.]